MANAKVNWYKERAVLAIENATDELLTALAFQCEGHAKVNIRDNGQIQTGFMLNSVYAVAPGGNHYSQAKSDAESKNPDGAMADEADVPEEAAAVAVGAEYAIYQEAQNSFLYRALAQVQNEAGGIIGKVKLK